MQLPAQLLSREPDSATLAPLQALHYSLGARAPKLSEKVGFEPTEPLGSTVFKTASFDHSDTSPRNNRNHTIEIVDRFVNPGDRFRPEGEI